jgi:hypothetical protein
MVVESQLQGDRYLAASSILPELRPRRSRSHQLASREWQYGVLRLKTPVFSFKIIAAHNQVVPIRFAEVRKYWPMCFASFLDFV